MYLYVLSRVWLFCNPMDCSLPGCSVHGILQARILEWVAISLSRGSSQPTDWTPASCVSCIGRQIVFHWSYLGSPKQRQYSLAVTGELIKLRGGYTCSVGWHDHHREIVRSLVWKKWIQRCPLSNCHSVQFESPVEHLPLAKVRPQTPPYWIHFWKGEPRSGRRCLQEAPYLSKWEDRAPTCGLTKPVQGEEGTIPLKQILSLLEIESVAGPPTSDDLSFWTH